MRNMPYFRFLVFDSNLFLIPRVTMQVILKPWWWSFYIPLSMANLPAPNCLHGKHFTSRANRPTLFAQRIVDFLYRFIRIIWSNNRHFKTIFSMHFFTKSYLLLKVAPFSLFVVINYAIRVWSKVFFFSHQCNDIYSCVNKLQILYTS